MEQREEFDLEDNEMGLLDEDDDTRGIVTAIPDELECVDKEDEDQFVNEQHEPFDKPELVQPICRRRAMRPWKRKSRGGRISMLGDHIHPNLLD